MTKKAKVGTSRHRRRHESTDGNTGHTEEQSPHYEDAIQDGQQQEQHHGYHYEQPETNAHTDGNADAYQYAYQSGENDEDSPYQDHQGDTYPMEGQPTIQGSGSLRARSTQGSKGVHPTESENRDVGSDSGDGDSDAYRGDYPTEEDPSAAAATATASHRTAPPTEPRGARTLTRAHALAQLRRGGPATLEAAQPPEKSSRLKSRKTSGAAPAAAAAYAQEAGSRSDVSAASAGGDANDDDEAAFSIPLKFHEKQPHQQQSQYRSRPGDGEVDGADGANGEIREGESEDEVPGTGVTHIAEEANSLSRMLRMQRTFESNMSHLYSFCATHVTEWPALAVEWIPDRKFEDPERDYSLQYLAIGTQTIRGAPNQVRAMEVAVPDSASAEAMYGLYGDEDIGPSDATGPDPEVEVDPGKRFKNVRGHFRCDQAITLDATVLKIRAMPAETNIIAATTASGFLGVYNLVQQQHEDEEGNTVPDAILNGHKMGGFGLSWNTVKPGYIASGADDGFVNYWDISHRITVDLKDDEAGYATNDVSGAGGRLGGAPDLSGRECEPLQKLSGHRDIITDVSWHNSQGHLLSSSSLDGDVRIWDIRVSNSSITINGAHEGGSTAAQFHPVGAFQLASAGMGGELCFWDIRRPKDPVLELAYHGRCVTGVQWAPFSETVIASYGEDGRVVVWDLGKTSLPLEYSADALAPPEVSFVHIGHLGVVTDFSWCPGNKDDWLMSSTDSFNGVHVYKPKESVVRDYLPRELW